MSDAVLLVVRHAASIALCGVALHCAANLITSVGHMAGRRSAMRIIKLASAFVPTALLIATSEH